MIKTKELTSKEELISALGTLSFEELANLKREFNKEFVEKESRKITNFNKIFFIMFSILVIVFMFIFFTIIINEEINFGSFAPIFAIAVFIPNLITRYKKQKIYQRLLELS